MTYATEIIHNYRFALRDLWNRYFYADPAFRDTQAVQDFLPLASPLFDALVVRRLDYYREPSSPLFGPDFLVVPFLNDINRTIRPLMIDTEIKGYATPRRWTLVSSSFKKDEIKLTLVDTFDWNLFTWRDFRYFLVLVEQCPQFPQYEGHEALVDAMEVDVMWNGVNAHRPVYNSHDPIYRSSDTDVNPPGK